MVFDFFWDLLDVDRTSSGVASGIISLSRFIVGLRRVLGISLEGDAHRWAIPTGQTNQMRGEGIYLQDGPIR
eukprot:7318101-Pyramimonas_sp.AAC.1